VSLQTVTAFLVSQEIDNISHLIPKLILNFLKGCRGIFDYIMQPRGRYNLFRLKDVYMRVVMHAGIPRHISQMHLNLEAPVSLSPVPLNRKCCGCVVALLA
jgi:hypothetical protein